MIFLACHACRPGRWQDSRTCQRRCGHASVCHPKTTRALPQYQVWHFQFAGLNPHLLCHDLHVTNRDANRAHFIDVNRAKQSGIYFMVTSRCSSEGACVVSHKPRARCLHGKLCSNNGMRCLYMQFMPSLRAVQDIYDTVHS